MPSGFDVDFVEGSIITGSVRWVGWEDIESFPQTLKTFVCCKNDTVPKGTNRLVRETPLPDQVKPDGERGRVVLDLHTVELGADTVFDAEQRLPALISATDTRGLDLAQSLPRLSALATANILQAPLIHPALLRQMPQLGQTLSTVHLIIPALQRQMSQFDQTIAALSSVLNNQVADTLRIVENLSLWIQELSRSIQFSFPPPNPLVSDLIAAMDRDPSAAERLALRIDWNPNHWQRESVKFKARIEGTSPKEVHKNALIQGVIRALGWEKEDQVPIQIGPESRWLYDEQENLATVSPMQFPMRFFWNWIKEEAIRAAGLWLVEYPYAPLVVLEAPPDPSSDWELARFTSLPTDEQSFTCRGRPLGSGVFENRQGFLEEVRLAVGQVKSRGNLVTQERVAEAMSERGIMAISGADRQLRHWSEKFGFAGWKALLRSL